MKTIRVASAPAVGASAVPSLGTGLDSAADKEQTFKAGDYFENLSSQASPESDGTSAFRRRAEASFDSFDRWKTDFASVGKMRGDAFFANVNWRIVDRRVEDTEKLRKRAA